MDIKRAVKTSGTRIGKCLCSYNIGFVHSDGTEDETQVTAKGLSDLTLLWQDLSQEFGVEHDSVTYVEEVLNWDERK